MQEQQSRQAEATHTAMDRITECAEQGQVQRCRQCRSGAANRRVAGRRRRAPRVALPAWHVRYGGCPSMSMCRAAV